MEYTCIDLERFDHIAVVTLNRPEVMNALNGTIMKEIEAVSRSFLDDEQTRVVIFRGGGKHFSAGADLKEKVSDSDTAPGRELCMRFDNVIQGREMPKRMRQKLYEGVAKCPLVHM